MGDSNGVAAKFESMLTHVERLCGEDWVAAGCQGQQPNRHSLSTPGEIFIACLVMSIHYTNAQAIENLSERINAIEGNAAAGQRRSVRETFSPDREARRNYWRAMGFWA